LAKTKIGAGDPKTWTSETFREVVKKYYLAIVFSVQKNTPEIWIER
jgi:hypothetical protein